MSKAIIKTKQLLSAVQALIDSGKYKKITGRYVSPKDSCACCWYGLILSVLADWGWVCIAEETFIATELGLQHHNHLERHIRDIDFTFLGIPQKVAYKDPLYSSLWMINDSSELSFQEIQNLVCKAVAAKGPKNEFHPAAIPPS